jgi:hypothetical protein
VTDFLPIRTHAEFIGDTNEVLFVDAELSAAIEVTPQVDEASNRIVIGRIAIHVDPSSRISTSVLQSIPVGRIEAHLNSLELEPQIRARLNSAGLDLRYIVGLPYDGFIELSRFKVRRDDDNPRNLGDDFYRRVAEAFDLASLHTSAPSTLLSEQNEVPMTTIARWVREARKRGHLAPTIHARKGDS